MKKYLLLIVLFSTLLIPSISMSVCEEGSSFVVLAEKAVGFEAKMENYSKALSKCPDSIEILTFMTDLYIEYEKYDEAFGIVYRIISLNKFKAEGYCKLAYIHTIWEEYDKAEEAVLQALKINNFYVDAYLVYGDIKYYSRDYKEAMKHYKKVLEIDPKNPDAFVKIATLYFLFEKYDKVIAYMDKALSVADNEELSMVRELIVNKSKNNYEGVRSAASKVLKKYPENLMALETLGIAMLENEKDKQSCLEILTTVYYLEKQTFIKGKIEKEIEKIVNSVASRNK